MFSADCAAYGFDVAIQVAGDRFDDFRMPWCGSGQHGAQMQLTRRRVRVQRGGDFMLLKGALGQSQEFGNSFRRHGDIFDEW